MAIIGKPRKRGSSSQENLGVEMSKIVKKSPYYKEAKSKKIDEEKLKGNTNGNNRQTNK